jgi:hypothetical protein
MTDEELIREMADMLACTEWQTRHAAENTYCPWCAGDDDDWKDQKRHHDGCKFVAVMEAAKMRLGLAK